MLLYHLLTKPRRTLYSTAIVDYYFRWSSALNDRDDAFYLNANVVYWLRQALDYLKQNGNKMTAARWLELSRSSLLSAPSVAAPHVAPVPLSPRPHPLDVCRTSHSFHIRRAHASCSTHLQQVQRPQPLRSTNLLSSTSGDSSFYQAQEAVKDGRRLLRAS